MEEDIPRSEQNEYPFAEHRRAEYSDDVFRLDLLLFGGVEFVDHVAYSAHCAGFTVLSPFNSKLIQKVLWTLSHSSSI